MCIYIKEKTCTKDSPVTVDICNSCIHQTIMKEIQYDVTRSNESKRLHQV